MSGISVHGDPRLKTTPNNEIVVGTGSTVSGTGDYAVCIGAFANVSTYGVSIGAGINNANQGAVGIGLNAKPNGDNSIAILGTTSDLGAIAIGTGANAKANSSYSIAIGVSATVGTGSTVGVAVGDGAVIADSMTKGLALGWSATVLHDNAAAIGGGAQSNDANDISLGLQANGGAAHSHVTVNGEFLRFNYKNASGSDPAAPAANTGLLYLRDNGAGKRQLVARFPTGAVQVIATEP